MDTYITNLETIRKHATVEEEENYRFRAYVKGYLPWSDRRFDAAVHRIAREVAAAIDCTQCAECCRTMGVSIEQPDIERLAAHLRLSVDTFETQYIVATEDGEKALASPPCPFLQDNRCSVYPARPRDCREFPHLLKPEMRTRMLQVLENAERCPLVFNTLERIKADIG